MKKLYFLSMFMFSLNIGAIAQTIPTVFLGNYTSGTWTQENVSVSITLGNNETAQDSLIKANGTVIHDWINCNNSITYMSDTNILVKYRSVLFSNYSTATSAYSIKIDKTPPVVTLTPSKLSNSGNRVLDTVSVQVKLSDALSGIDSVVWTLKTNTGLPISGKISPTNSDTTFILMVQGNSTDDTITVTAYDKAGNAQASSLFAFLKKRPYNTSEVLFLQKFLRKPSAVIGKLNIDQLWIGNVADTTTWKEYWADNIKGLTWSVSGDNRQLTKINWTNLKLSDTLNLQGFSLLDTVQIGQNEIRSFQNIGTEGIKQLLCFNNKLNAIDTNYIKALKDFSCYGNTFRFSTLPLRSFAIYNYSPQDTIKLQQGVSDTINLSAEYDISGQSTTYKWYENGVEISANKYQALGNGKFIFPDSYAGKTIIGNMQNGNFPNLILVCRLNLAEIFENTEIQKLKTFLLKNSAESGKTNGEQVGIPANADWNYASNLLASIKSITWNIDSPKRVQAIDWSSKKLADSFDISDFTKIEFLTLNNNKLIGLNIAGNTGLRALNCENNLFRFSTLPKQRIGTGDNDVNYLYKKQGRIDNTIAITDIVDFSQEHIITREGETPQTTTYEWLYQNNSAKDAASNLGGGKFYISDKYAGKTLTCILTNQAFPGLNLEASIQVNIVYDTAELTQLKTFLRQPLAETGKKNIEQLGVQVENWDFFSHLVPQLTTIEWNTTSPKKVTDINWSGKSLTGKLILTNFASLKTLKCNNNSIDSLNVNNAPSLTTIECNNNSIEWMLLSSVGALANLACENNYLLYSSLPKEMIANYTYSPQHERNFSIYIFERLDLSKENMVVRNTNSYQTQYTLIDAVTSAPIDINLYTISADGYISFSPHLENETVICKLVNEGFTDLELSILVELKKPHYNTNELNQLKTFLEKLSANGTTTNAEQLGIDINYWDSPGKWPVFAGVSWKIDYSTGNAYLLRIEWNRKELAGSIDFSNFIELKFLSCQENAITTINVANCSRLEEFDCFKNLITSVDISGCSEMLYLTISLNKIETLNLSPTTKLIELYCHQNKIKNLNTNTCAVLKTLSCYNNEINNLDISGAVSLQKLYCQGNALKFSTLPTQEYSTYDYFYQDSILFTNVSTNTPIDLSSEFNITRNGQSHNTIYTWYLKGSETPITNGITAKNGVFTFNSSFENHTVYGTMTNANFPELTLKVQINFFVTGESKKPVIDQTPVIQTVLYPNPASNVFNLEISGLSGKLNMAIFDNTGKVLLEQTLQHVDNGESKQISIQTLPKGMYYVRLSNKEFNRVLKLIVQ